MKSKVICQWDWGSCSSFSLSEFLWAGWAAINSVATQCRIGSNGERLVSSTLPEALGVNNSSRTTPWAVLLLATLSGKTGSVQIKCTTDIWYRYIFSSQIHLVLQKGSVLYFVVQNQKVDYLTFLWALAEYLMQVV